MAIHLNQPIPNFSVSATNNQTIEVSQLLGHNIVIYFYPKDATPGCTIESKGFRDAFEDFKACNTLILGVSKDTLSSHEKFKKSHDFPFELIADVDKSLCQLFEVLKEKSMFGKKYLGIERSTFLIDVKGILRHEWRKVKITGHVADVLAKAQAINHITAAV